MEVVPGLSNLGPSDALAMLLGLLPGFLTAEIISAFAIRERREPLDRIIQALLYTFLSHVTWIVFCKTVGSGRDVPWSSGGHVVGLGICALLWGVVGVWLVNAGILHRRLRKWHFTKRTSRPYAWYDAFYRTTQYVVVHLKDRRRILGWPKLYPENPGQGHLFLVNARWLSCDNAKEESRISILIDSADVQFVEFICKEPENVEIPQPSK